jgi:hypothetical protein
MQTIYKSLQAADLDKLEYVTPHFALDFKQQTRGRSQGWCTVEDVKSLLTMVARFTLAAGRVPVA